MHKDMCVACDDGSKYTFPWTNRQKWNRRDRNHACSPKLEFCFLSTVCKRPFGLFFFCPYIANIVMPCKPLIFTLNAPLRAVKICPSSETSVCAPETSALVR